MLVMCSKPKRAKPLASASNVADSPARLQALLARARSIRNSGSMRSTKSSKRGSSRQSMKRGPSARASARPETKTRKPSVRHTTPVATPTVSGRLCVTCWRERRGKRAVHGAHAAVCTLSMITRYNNRSLGAATPMFNPRVRTLHEKLTKDRMRLLVPRVAKSYVQLIG